MSHVEVKRRSHEETNSEWCKEARAWNFNTSQTQIASFSETFVQLNSALSLRLARADRAETI